MATAETSENSSRSGDEGNLDNVQKEGKQRDMLFLKVNRIRMQVDKKETTENLFCCLRTFFFLLHSIFSLLFSVFFFWQLVRAYMCL